MNKSMAVAIIDRLFLVAYGTEPPTEHEWGAYLALVEQQGVDRTLQLVHTAGGEPTAAQRRQLDAILAGRVVPVAIVTDNARVRASTILLSWFNRQIRAFPCSRLDDALSYLGNPASRTSLVEREIDRLRRQLSTSCQLSDRSRTTCGR